MKKLIIAILIISLAIPVLVSPVQAKTEEYYDDPVSIKVTTTEPSVSYHALTEWYSPVIVQDVGCPRDPERFFPCGDKREYGDYITRIDYDGDYIGNNNWNNLGYPETARPLPAYVYCSVMETPTHYFIWYALFHPADDFHCGCGPDHRAQHENDMEGMVMCVHKNGSTYGHLRMVQLQAHNDFYQYTPPGENGIYDEDDDIDGTIALDSTYPGVHPVVYVEGGGHGLRHEDTGDWPSVIYYYTGNAEDPDVVGHSHCGYDLLSIFAEMWEQRTNCCGSGHLFDNWGDYKRWGFSVEGLGKKFDGDSGTQKPDKASPPWNWDDNDDGDKWLNGDWFMHPAGYHGLRFGWIEDFSTNYIFHPFGYDHLGGDIYNGRGGTTALSHGPYRVVSDITILSDQVLAIEPGVTVKFNRDTSFISDGTTEADGSGGTIRFVSDQYLDRGIKIDGELHLQNGGCIRFP